MTKYSQTLIIKQALYILRERELEREREGILLRVIFITLHEKNDYMRILKRMLTSKASVSFLYYK